jgi:hypothetical protein
VLDTAGIFSHGDIAMANSTLVSLLGRKLDVIARAQGQILALLVQPEAQLLGMLYGPAVASDS